MTARYDGLVTGRARFTADIATRSPAQEPTDTAVLVFVRSTEAHARIVSIDTEAARQLPGVLAVLTADDLDVEAIWEITIVPEVLAQPPLASRVVRYVGERIAAVVAADLATAIDAAEAVVVDLDPLPVVADPLQAGRDDAGLVVEEFGSNIALSWDESARHSAGTGDVGVPASNGPDGGNVTVCGRVAMPRLSVAPMEPLSILAEPDGDALVLHVSTQVPGAVQIQTARSLHMPLDRVRVIAPRVGGAFGGKSLGGVADYVVTAAAARLLERPVRFTEDRTSNLITMQGRGVVLDYELVATVDGRAQHLSVTEYCDAGAYASTNAVEPGKSHVMACGPYRIGALDFRAASVLTNRSPSGAYRGPGRSEAAMVIEGALDRLAARLGIDPVEIRRRNLLHPAELPDVSPGGARRADSDFIGLLDTLVERADYASWCTHRDTTRAASVGRRLGIGIATVIDSSAWFQRDEEAITELVPDGSLVVHVATSSAGQEHRPMFAALAANAIGVSQESLRVIEGDTVRIAGYGSTGSRSTQLAGSAVHESARELAAMIRTAAAGRLEASPDDVVLGDDHAHVAGVPARRISFAELAAHHGPLVARRRFVQAHATYPSAAMCAVVEVDVETGSVRPVAMHVVVDCGTVLDPSGAHGQVVGAVAQAVGQTLYEEAAYDAGATPLATNLAEYGMPGPTEVPPVDVTFRPVFASTNPLGAKGVGEIGMIAAPAALYAAVKDALGGPDVDLALPCTSERIWQALRNGHADERVSISGVR